MNYYYDFGWALVNMSNDVNPVSIMFVDGVAENKKFHVYIKFADGTLITSPHEYESLEKAQEALNQMHEKVK